MKPQSRLEPVRDAARYDLLRIEIWRHRFWNRRKITVFDNNGPDNMSPTDHLKPGMTGTLTQTVTADKTAPVVGSGSVEVFATPMLVALMEGAACAAIDPHLPETHTSLGLKIEVLHTAPTPVGLDVNAEAELIDVSGRKLVFQITAHDCKDVIGKATHTRVVVDRKRFEESLKLK